VLKVAHKLCMYVVKPEYVLAVSFVSSTSISLSGQQRSATSLSLSEALRRRRLRATSTASSRSTNRTALMGLYVAALSTYMPSTSAMTWRPGVVGTNLAEPSIWACKFCIWFAYSTRKSATDERTLRLRSGVCQFKDEGEIREQTGDGGRLFDV
jgi:hypothetical protein